MLGLQLLSIIPGAVILFLCSELWFYNLEIKCNLKQINFRFYFMRMSVFHIHMYVHHVFQGVKRGFQTP